MKILTPLLVIILVLAISPKLHATTGLNDSILTEYLKLQKEYSDESCKAGTESAFQDLDKTYRGDGNFIPISLDEKVDLKTIKVYGFSRKLTSLKTFRIQKI
jgi:hypothetical protein